LIHSLDYWRVHWLADRQRIRIFRIRCACTTRWPYGLTYSWSAPTRNGGYGWFQSLLFAGRSLASVSHHSDRKVSFINVQSFDGYH
jgi:hypothetical protein